MNKIKVGRLLLAGFATLIVFILLEVIVEGFFFNALFSVGKWGLPQYSPPRWGIANQVLNISLALLNSIMMIWLYAALRPMFGVGPKTALIASGFAFAFIFSLGINFANLGFYPIQPALIELFAELIELPLALLAGAYVYEGGWEENDQPATTLPRPGL
jgi:hypothetical protein